MFGYVKPAKGELLVKEFEFYRATYCGICRSMKKHTGVFSNATLSYDSVFLALVRMLYIDDSEISAGMHRCIAHPLTKRPMLHENSAIEYTAYAFALLAYYKLDDDAFDEHFVKKLTAGFMRTLVSSSRKHAATRRLAEIMKSKLGAIRALEEQGCRSVDEGATLFGEILGEVFSYGLEGNDALVTYRCGYHLGRFIYSADAIDDYEKDVKSGAYNPYVAAYGGAALTEENKRTVHTALLLECKALESAVNLLPFGSKRTIEGIISNIIYTGLTDRIEFLISGRGSEPDKKGDK